MSASNGINTDIITDIQVQNGILFAATWGSGVYTSINNGSSFSPFGSGLTDPFVRSLNMDEVNLYAATDAGAFSYSFTTAISVAKEQETFGLYPNPSSGMIYLAVHSGQRIVITVSTLIGDLVYRFEGYSDGQESFDLSRFPKGVYSVCIRTGTEVMNKKLIIQ